MRTMRRTVAGVIVTLVGAAFLGSVLVNDLFSVGPAFERLSDGFRPVMQAEAVAALEQDLTGFRAVGDEFATAAVPLLSEALQLTPEAFQGLMLEQFPDVATGMQELPGIIERFDGVVATLDGELERFASADAIPTSSLPATAVPWGLTIAGVVLVLLGVAIVALPGRTTALAAALVGAALIVAPLVMSLPGKASDADTMNEHLQPVYTTELIAGANESLATVGAMGSQMQEAMLPALSAQLGMDEAQLQGFLQENLPATAGALGAMPDAMGRFSFVVEAFASNLDDFDTIKAVAFVPIVWTMIGGGAVALLAGLAAALGTKRRPLVEAAVEPSREAVLSGRS